MAEKEKVIDEEKVYIMAPFVNYKKISCLFSYNYYSIRLVIEVER